ncbi:MAG: DUF4340 domain-containing protein [Phycisphaerae bacterium]|nr:DUF4340 domain-containing protein [Phycisphaerae bacterium]
MKPKTTIVLIVLLVLAGLGVWIGKVIRRRAAEQAAAAAPAGRVFPLATGEAKKLTVETRDGEKLVFVRPVNRWNMIEPRLLATRAEKIDPIVRLFSELKFRRALADGAPSETAMGLDRPRWTVTLVEPSERTYTLQVGSPAPKIGGDEETYVRVGKNGPVYVVPRDLADLLQLDVKDYRDMAVLPEARRDAISSIHVAGRENYTLRKTLGGWDIVEPVTARAGKSAVGKLLTNLTGDLKAERFLAESPTDVAQYGLDKPQLEVTVTLQSPATDQETPTPRTPESFTLLLGNHRGKSICAMVKGKPEVFTLPEAMLDDLQPPLETLRAKMLLTFNPADVNSVQIQRDRGNTLLLRRNGGVWMMVQPFAGPADDEAVEHLLQTLSNAQADQWITPAAGKAMDLPSPRATITLHRQNGDPVALRIGGNRDDGKSVFCRPAGAAAIAAVDREEIDQVLPPARKYWSKLLLPIPPDADIPGMTIDRPDGSHVLVKYDDAWRLAAPVTGPANENTVEEILKTLTGLKANVIGALGTSLPKAYADAKDRITVSVTTRGENGESARTYRLCVVKINDNVFAWTADMPVVAVGRMDENLYTTLNQPIQKK